MERNCNNCKNPDCFWVGVDDDEICDEYLPKTNADRIRIMTDEELAYFIASDYYVPHCPVDGECLDDHDGCDGCWLVWLKQESGEA